MKYLIFSSKHIFTPANTFSIGAIIFGFFSLFLILEEKYHIAFNLILLGVLCDILDGYIARKTQTVSELGASLDLMSDIFLYVLSPVFLLYSSFKLDLFGYFILVLFLLTSILRLILFSTRGFDTISGKLYYQGMPVYFHLILFQCILQGTDLLGLYMLFIIMTVLMIVKIPFRKYGLSISFMYVVSLFVFHNLSFLG